MRYCPEPSVVVDFTRSMSASLVASTVTPGSTAPVMSLTTPTIADCASATSGTAASEANVASTPSTSLPRFITHLRQQTNRARGAHDGCGHQGRGRDSEPSDADGLQCMVAPRSERCTAAHENLYSL